MPRNSIITLTTDFGLQDHFVGTMKGVMVSINPDLAFVDITHSVQPFDVFDAALSLAQAYSYFPSGTVHLVIVDPGVGTARRPIVASTEKYHFVAPDNGVLSLIYEREERLSVRSISAEHYFLQPLSNTFHGRDIFSPIAAYLSKGVDPARMGGEVTDFVRFAAPRPKSAGNGNLRGVVLKIDRFGNLITNITARDAPGLFRTDPPPFKITVGRREVTAIRSAYAEGAAGEVFAIIGSMGFLEIAANRGAASKLVEATKGMDVMLLLEDAAGRRPESLPGD
ncbi:MAG: SAM-dependent chlorinase/fluorinase [Acidobacteria bacterium]|nr:SAM-dependent chlorinase/fluorinase [Acidobacteriota bacterium]